MQNMNRDEGGLLFFCFLFYCSSSTLSTVCKQHSVSHRVSGVCLHLREHLGSQGVCAAAVRR